jgi:hypothetical protein
MLYTNSLLLCGALAFPTVGYTQIDYSTINPQPTDTTVMELELNDTFTSRSGRVNGKPFSSMEMDFGNGYSTETINYDGGQFNCTTVDLGGYATTSCY